MLRPWTLNRQNSENSLILNEEMLLFHNKYHILQRLISVEFKIVKYVASVPFLFVSKVLFTWSLNDFD